MSMQVKKQKAKTWKVFSRYIRLRDCLERTGDPQWGNCFTCGRSKPFKELQAGHFIEGRGNAVLFHEDLVHTQCAQCNIFKHGNLNVYERKMVELYGEQKVQEFLQLRLAVKKWKPGELEEIEQYFIAKTDSLLHPALV